MSKGISELSRINRNIMEFKVPFSYACPYIRQGINRNIMEFKGIYARDVRWLFCRINRNIMEFKGFIDRVNESEAKELIET